jgi:peptide deformylase
MKHLVFKKKVFEEAALTSHLTYQIGEFDGLRKKSQEVEVSKINSKEIRSIILKLKKTLKEYRRLTGKGRGVAAIQIGYPLRIAVIFQEENLLTIINPKIITTSKTKFKYPEICMSANPIIAKVSRPSYIEFEYLDEKGNEQIWDNKKDKIMNRVLQHEIDHMDGIINIDLVKSSDLILLSEPNFFKKSNFTEVKK